jgi:CDP-glucose 4,6-dehydratase
LTPEELRSVYRGRRVLVTGHGTFQGGWLATWLAELGARVAGHTALPDYEPNLFAAARVADCLVADVQGDIRELAPLEAAWKESRPEVVFHLAAQPLVEQGHRDPLGTVAINVLGVANLLELARRKPSPAALVIVTSDRCYDQRSWPYAYRETDPLGGDDVASASQSAAEMLAHAFHASFLAERGVGVATARAGSAMGGGDWTPGLLVPECIRALAANAPVTVRRPRTVRPWQHVLEPLSGYLTVGGRLLAAGPGERQALSGPWNFAPAAAGGRTVWELVEAVIANWGSGTWERVEEPTGKQRGSGERGERAERGERREPQEPAPMRLSIDKARETLGWMPRWSFEEMVAQTVDWYKAYYAGDDMGGWCRRQIAAYMEPDENLGS